MADPLAQYFDEKDPLGNFFDKPQNAREELRAKAFVKTPDQLRKEIMQQQAGEENARQSSWLPTIGTGGAAVVRTAGGMIPGGPIASEPLAQLYENVAGTRQGFSPGMMAAETGLSLVPGGKIAKGALKLAPRIGKTGAQLAEHAVMGEAATALPAAIEGQPYTPGLGAAGGVALGAAAKGVGKIIPEGIGARIGTKVEQAVAPRTDRSKKLVYGALSEGVGHRTPKAQRLEKELNNGLEPVFDFAAQSKRKINNVEDLKTAAKDMTRVTDVEFNNAVESVGDRMVSGKPIAQEIRGEITELVRRTNPAQAEKLEQLAASFDRDMPIREVNQLRQEANNVLDNFYSKSPLQQEHPAVGIAAQSSMADGLRNVLYDNLEQMFPDDAIRKMMRERGAAEGISKYASESAGAARRTDMAGTNVRGPITTPLTLGAKAVKTVTSPYETSKKIAKYAQRPDRKISEAYKLYIPKKSTIAEPLQPKPPQQKQLPYRTGPDPSGVSPMSQQGVGAQFEAVSQGMGQGRPGQLQLPAIGETPGSTYNALAGTGPQGGGNLGQRLLPAAPDIQVPGGFSQLSDIQSEIEKMIQQPRSNALAAQGYNPNQLFEGGRMRDPAQQLQRQRMDPDWEAGRSSFQTSTEDIIQILNDRGFVVIPPR